MNASRITDVDRVLAITAHPDDIDFGSAGTIATLTDAGVDAICGGVLRFEGGALATFNSTLDAQTTLAHAEAPDANLRPVDVTGARRLAAETAPAW